MAEIVIQAVGVGMEEALIVSWLKQPGDAVAVDDRSPKSKPTRPRWTSSARSQARSGRAWWGRETSSRWARRSWRSSTKRDAGGRAGAGRA